MGYSPAKILILALFEHFGYFWGNNLVALVIQINLGVQEVMYLLFCVVKVYTRPLFAALIKLILGKIL